MLITRRLFGHLAALGVSLPALAPLARAQATGRRAAESHRYFGGFRIGLQSRTLADASLNRLIETAKSDGVRYIELSPVHADLRKAETTNLRAMRAKLLDAGISILAYGVVPFDDRRERNDAEAIFRHAQELGVPTLVVDPPREFVKELRSQARRFGVAAAILNRAGGPFAGAERVLDAIKGRTPHLGACADTAAFILSGRNPAAEIRALGDALLDVHLTDVTDAGASCPPGKGKLDVGAVLKSLRGMGYAGGIMVDFQGVRDPAQALAGCLDGLRQLTAR